jgi:protoporphyrinogen oxidase
LKKSGLCAAFFMAQTRRSMRIFKEQVVGGAITYLEVDFFLVGIGDEVHVFIHHTVTESVQV